MTLRLRHVARINPATPEFDRLLDDAILPFLPLEAVWPGERLDVTRRKAKADVSVGYTRFREGDILVPKITPTFQADRTVIARNLEGGLAAGTTELHVVRVTASVADVGYVRYLLSSKAFLDEGEASMTGVAGQKRVPDDCLRDLAIPVIHRETQRAISSFLDTETARIDALIAKKRRMMSLLEERFLALRQTTVLAGLNPVTGTCCQRADWDVLALGVLVALHRGFDLPSQARTEGRVPIVSSGGISGSHDQKGRDGPGVITGRYGTVGQVFYIEGPYWPLNTTLFVSEFRGNHPRWVFHLLSVLPLDIDSAKSAVTGINRNVVGGLYAPRPSLHDQVTLAEALDGEQRRHDHIEVQLAQQIALLAEHRQALIAAAVTGELEIPGVAA